MVNKKKSKKKNFIVLSCILGIILVGVIMINFYLFMTKPIYQEEVAVAFQVGEDYGLLATNHSLDFGILIPGSSVDRFVTLENKYSFPMEIKVFISPEIHGYIFGSKNVVIDPYEEVVYRVSLQIPRNMTYQNVSGTIQFEGYPFEE
jgi:hypothetical protein